MTADFDIHLASPDERRQAHGNVHDVWSRGLPLGQHVARREQAPHHKFAQWIVGCQQGQVVASLACHPFEFLLNGKVTQGIGIASVHTVLAARGQGLAPRLIAWTERWAVSQGRTLSLLFSDVDPDYYERMGYVRCPAWEGFRENIDNLYRPTVDCDYVLSHCDPAQSLAELSALYGRFVADRPLAVCRYTDYWRNLLARRPHDVFQWLTGADAERLGYVRFSPIPEPLFVGDPIGQPTGWKLSDYAFQTATDEFLLAALRLGLAWAERQGAQQFGGWFPDTPAARTLFDLHPRKTEITMFKALAEPVKWTPALLAAADQICEIDHV